MQNQGLTKKQLCWVIIRGFGIYLLATNAIMLVATIILFIVFKVKTPQLIPPMVMFSAVLTSALMTCIGYYLVTNGEWVYKIINCEGSSYSDDTTTPSQTRQSKPEPVDPETQLTKSEEEQFRKWLSDNPEIKSRQLIDQLALFRDFLRENSEDSS